MEVSLKAVRRVFEDVLNGYMSREQADRWACAVVQEQEAGIVAFSPPHEREHIWAGVMYLFGIDAMKAPGAYLHSDDDIREAMMASRGAVSGREAGHVSRMRSSRYRSSIPGTLGMEAPKTATRPSGLGADQLDVLLRRPAGDVAPP
jgi:hypothetical protein